MKKLSILLLSLITSTLMSQEALKTELFEVDLIMKYQTDISLSEPQKKSIQKVHDAHFTTFNSAKWELEAEMKKLNGMIGESQINESATLKQMAVVNELEDLMKRIRLEMLIRVKNELTSIQQSKLKELRQDSDMKPTSLVTAINDGQKIKLQIGKNDDKNMQPLFVVIDANGERFISRDQMKSLVDPNNIESVNVIKGKSATLSYGKKGKNGVIVIKMKQKKYMFKHKKSHL